MANLVLLRMAKWVLARSEFGILRVEGILHNWVASLLSTPFKVDRVVSWAPIRDVVLKFNVDGAARDKSGPVGIGEVLHISGGEVLVLF